MRPGKQEGDEKGAEVSMTSDKYSTPPGSSTALSWFKRDLDQKADTAWVEVKLEVLSRELAALRDREDDTKNIAIRAKERAGMPHDCLQKEYISRLESEVVGWSKWWRGILVSFIGVIITVGGSGLYQYFNLSTAVEDTRTTIVDLDKSVKDIEESQQELKQSVDDSLRKDDERANAHLDDIKGAILQALQESKKAGSK